MVGCRDWRGAPQLTGVLAIADTMAAHARLTSVLLAVNYHCEEVVWPARAAGGTTAMQMVGVVGVVWKSVRGRECVEKWKLELQVGLTCTERVCVRVCACPALWVRHRGGSKGAPGSVAGSRWQLEPGKSS